MDASKIRFPRLGVSSGKMPSLFSVMLRVLFPPSATISIVSIIVFAGCNSREQAQNQKPDPMIMFPSDSTGDKQAVAPGDARARPDTSAADLQGLNELLREYVRTTKKIPKELNELVSSGFVQALPEAPAGKVFSIVQHPLGYQVVLLNQ